jgi:DNA-binding CsgD family transcriptional regulator
LKTLFLFTFFISTIGFSATVKNIEVKLKIHKQELKNDLPLKEFKKFKHFKSRLANSTLSVDDKFNQLKNYSRDSLKILSVKLVAIKMLEENRLLDRDISENTEYYQNLLIQLKNSKIERIDYLFLEDRINVITTEILKQKIQFRNRFTYGLIFLILILSILIFQLLKRNPKIQNLSKQEVTVKNLIIQGKSNKEIASELFISLSTVKSHITNIYRKLNVTNRQQLVQKSTGTSS